MRGIVYDGQAPVLVDDLEVVAPGSEQVRVEIGAAGLCHSDASVIDPDFGGMYEAPFVLGHEGAGVVVEVGPDVTTASVGDHVVITTIDNCGHCARCVTGHPTWCQNSKLSRAIGESARTGQPVSKGLPAGFTWQGEAVVGMANTGVFAEEVVVDQVQVVPIDKSVPFESACLIGCGVLTGTGAVFNRARVYRGDLVAVIGVGGIGLNVIQAARIAGATRIVAIDNNPDKEAFARQFGATDFVDTADGGFAPQIAELTGDGVDHCFECVGNIGLMEEAIGALAPGGQLVVLGVAGPGAEMAVSPFRLYHDKGILGCRYGSSRPAYDIPVLIDLYLDGRLQLDELVSARYRLAALDEALHDLHAGRLARGVLTLD